MNMFTSKIEKRILEIQSILNDENREKEIGAGIPMEIFHGRLKNANRSLLAELEELKTRRQFAHDNRQLLINTASILVALLVAFLVPIIFKPG